MTQIVFKNLMLYINKRELGIFFFFLVYNNLHLLGTSNGPHAMLSTLHKSFHLLFKPDVVDVIIHPSLASILYMQKLGLRQVYELFKVSQ